MIPKLRRKSVLGMRGRWMRGTSQLPSWSLKWALRRRCLQLSLPCCFAGSCSGVTSGVECATLHSVPDKKNAAQNELRYDRLAYLEANEEPSGCRLLLSKLFTFWKSFRVDGKIINALWADHLRQRIPGKIHHTRWNRIAWRISPTSLTHDVKTNNWEERWSSAFSRNYRIVPMTLVGESACGRWKEWSDKAVRHPSIPSMIFIDIGRKRKENRRKLFPKAPDVWVVLGCSCLQTEGSENPVTGPPLRRVGSERAKIKRLDCGLRYVTRNSLKRALQDLIKTARSRWPILSHLGVPIIQKYVWLA